MASIKLQRRSFLRGIGGVALALPALEIMGSSSASAQSTTIAKRYVFSYAGVSTGSYTSGGHGDLLVPSTVGLGYEPTHALQPLFDLGVQSDVSIVSGLKIPWASSGNIGPGARQIEFHYGTITPQICGMRSLFRGDLPSAPTSDQIVADLLAPDPEHRVLNYRVQPVNYNGATSVGDEGRLSWKRVGDEMVAIDPIVSPRLAYESLFTGFTPTDEAEAAKAKALLARRKSAIDLVRGSIDRVLPHLGKADHQRLERHLDEVRGLELRLDQIDPSGGACKLLPEPGQDPAIGGGIVGGETYATNSGYSNEELRADVLTDIIAMAFACDLYRVAAFQLTMWKSWINMYQIAGWQSDLHELSHDGPLEALSDGVAWHVKHFGRLVKKLKDMPEVDGSNVLDHTAAVLVFEGGHGYDPEGANDNSPHSTENMAVLVAGRAGGLRPGQHVVAADQHPAQAVASAMNAVGVEGDLGEVSGNIPELFV